MEVKKDFALKASSSKATNLEEDGSDTDVDSSDEEMRLFVRIYNNYMKKKDFKHRQNIFIGPLNFTLVTDRSFKFFK
jgi:hypothetical protein